MITHPQVDVYIDDATQWMDEMQVLRSILIECGLTEDFKWKAPCYTHQGRNMVMIANFKHYFALSFFNGAILKDSHRLLVKPGKNTQSGRQLRFLNSGQILQYESIIKEYISEAIRAEEVEIKAIKKNTHPIEYVEELKKRLEADPEFKAAFNSLTLGKRRGYNIYISGAVQSATRSDRIEKNVKRILDGYGLHDCTCGLSKRMPRCDGSHKDNKKL